jgi:hypothetical protein
MPKEDPSMKMERARKRGIGDGGDGAGNRIPPADGSCARR